MDANTAHRGPLDRRRLLSGGAATLAAGGAALVAATPAQAVRWYYPSEYPKLKIGMVSPYVGQGIHCLRGDLYYFGYRNQADRNSNHFDLWVQGAVLQMQRRFGAQPDGVVGPKTWGLIEIRRSPEDYRTVRRGSASTMVFNLQRALVATVRVALDNDGKFGPATDSAVRAYQRSRGLVVDGVVGAKTWGRLRTGR